ncbi:ATP-dependent Clp protease proteolytic subunit [Flavobacteriaceae bacterium TK19130]|nr:ATP-dependent Clp protease proteolytic subunit [Thermobacterium salinum]
MSNKLDTYFKIVQNKAEREATIYIYGVIGGYDWEKGEYINTASQFSEEFKKVEDQSDTIHVRINSPGGYVFEGLAIYNALYSSEKNIITYNDGLCASMAFLIFLSGDERKGFKNSLLMAHNSSSVYFGNKQEVEEQLEAADKIDSALGTVLEDVLGISEDEVKEKYLNYKDNWFTAKEGKTEGFYTQLINKKDAKTPKGVKNMARQEVFQKYAAMAFSFPIQNLTPNNSTMSKPNSYPHLEKALGLESPLASNDNGSFLNEEQKATIETSLTSLQTRVSNAEQAKQSAEEALAEAKNQHDTALNEAKKATNDAVTNLREAAALAGVEDLAEDANLEQINAALTEKINELNGKPGDSHTAIKNKDPKPSQHEYLDFDNSIYSQLKN